MSVQRTLTAAREGVKQEKDPGQGAGGRGKLCEVGGVREGRLPGQTDRP